MNLEMGSCRVHGQCPRSQGKQAPWIFRLLEFRGWDPDPGCPFAHLCCSTFPGLCVQTHQAPVSFHLFWSQSPWPFTCHVRHSTTMLRVPGQWQVFLYLLSCSSFWEGTFWIVPALVGTQEEEHLLDFLVLEGFLLLLFAFFFLN